MSLPVICAIQMTELGDLIHTHVALIGNGCFKIVGEAQKTGLCDLEAGLSLNAGDLRVTERVFRIQSVYECTKASFVFTQGPFRGKACCSLGALLLLLTAWV